MSDTGAKAEVDSTANVTSFTAQAFPQHAQTGVASGDRPLAAVSVPDPAASASDFTATIDWGDGSPTDAGTITAQNALLA